jgi:predicted acyl esterase
MPKIIIEKNILVSMRDWVKLAIGAYRQNIETPAPAPRTRAPYNKDDIAGGFDILRVIISLGRFV